MTSPVGGAEPGLVPSPESRRGARTLKEVR